MTASIPWALWRRMLTGISMAPGVVAGPVAPPAHVPEQSSKSSQSRQAGAKPEPIRARDGATSSFTTFAPSRIARTEESLWAMCPTSMRSTRPGNLCGTTYSGGSHASGVAFEIGSKPIVSLAQRAATRAAAGARRCSTPSPLTLEVPARMVLIRSGISSRTRLIISMARLRTACSSCLPIKTANGVTN